MKLGFGLLSFLFIINSPLLAADLLPPSSSLPDILPAKSALIPTAVPQLQPTKSQPTESEHQPVAQQPAELKPLSAEVPKTEAALSTFAWKQITQPVQAQNTISEKLNSTSNTNEEISKKIDILKQSPIEKLYPAIFGFLGVLLGGLINFLLHKSQLSHHREERKHKFSFEVKQKIFEYRNKQNNDFYGPLLVLLAQSKELSSQLHDQIQKFDNIRYTYRTNITESKPKKTLHVISKGRTIPFRLIEELPYLGKYIRASLPQVAVIIEVGEQLSALIERSSGLANPKNLELSGCLGNYLAHLRALKDSYAQAKDSTSSEPTRLYTAVFPRQIYDLAKKDYDDINAQIAEWEHQSNLDTKG
ncbi:hypothetical protein [Pseudomonas sp.]|uniref:hypothetical protein n=1 Tax=Pseudomonas sp. TaxID=306 RepID=UPI00260F3FF6|nr:hypothetical protein [Pseudomonas sp.]